MIFSEIYIFLEAHLKKILAVLMIVSLLYVKNTVIDIAVLNMINSNLKTKTLLFSSEIKSGFVFKGYSFSGKKKEVILSNREEKILRQEDMWKRLNMPLTILCFLPLGILIRRNTTRGKGGLLAKGVDIFYPKKYKGTNVIEYNSEDGVVIGNYAGKRIADNSQTHVLINANTGAGKGVGPVITTHIDGWKNSIISADLKGEIYEKTAGYRQKFMGNKCFFLDFSDFNSAKYNPLLVLKKGHKTEIDYSKLTAKNIVAATAGINDKEKFWIDSATNLFQTGELIALYTIKDRPINMTDINNFFNQENLKEHVKKLKKEFRLTEEEILQLSDYYPEAVHLLSQYKHPEIERGFNAILDTPDETFTSVLMNLKNTLNHFLGTVTKQVVSGNSFTAKDFTFYKKPISLYLKIDFKQIEIMLPLLNVILGSIIMELLPKEEKGKEYYRNKRPVINFYDEFTAFGKLPIVEEIITFTRSFFLKFVFVIQDTKQLNKVYGNDNSFWSNCKTKVFFNLDDDKDNIKIISELTGTRTVLEKPPIFGGALFRNVHHGTRGNFVQQEVLSIEDIRGLRADKGILLMGNKTAIINKEVYFKSKELLKRTKIMPVKDRL